MSRVRVVRVRVRVRAVLTVVLQRLPFVMVDWRPRRGGVLLLMDRERTVGRTVVVVEVVVVEGEGALHIFSTLAHPRGFSVQNSPATLYRTAWGRGRAGRGDPCVEGGDWHAQTGELVCADGVERVWTYGLWRIQTDNS